MLYFRLATNHGPLLRERLSCDECKGLFARGCEAKRWSHWTCSSLGTIFQPMRINSVPDVKCFCNNKSVLCSQSMVWHFVRHPVYCSFESLFVMCRRYAILLHSTARQTWQCLHVYGDVFRTCCWGSQAQCFGNDLFLLWGVKICIE